MTSHEIASLEPGLVWSHFLALTRIPRPPKQEEQVRAHVLAWAGERGFDSDVDDAGNAVVRVPASDGRAGAPTVVLQAHLDMVCERDPDSPNDPRAGRIEVVRDGDWVTAMGTTLGADNGIGVAGAMAAGEDRGSLTVRSSCSSRCPRSKGSTAQRSSILGLCRVGCSSTSTGRATTR